MNLHEFPVSKAKNLVEEKKEEIVAVNEPLSDLPLTNA